MGRRMTEKVLYRDEVDEDCEEKDCGGCGPDEEEEEEDVED